MYHVRLDGTAVQIQARRAAVLDAAYAANPERFRQRPTPPTPPTKAWINPTPATIETEEPLHKSSCVGRS